MLFFAHHEKKRVSHKHMFVAISSGEVQAVSNGMMPRVIIILNSSVQCSTCNYSYRVSFTVINFLMCHVVVGTMTWLCGV